MDANGTHHFLLLGHDDWANCALDPTGVHRVGDTWPPNTIADRSLDWDAALSELTLKKDVFRFAAPPRAVLPEIADRRGADRDRNGNWYWIADNQQEILVNSAGSGNTGHFWSTIDPVSCVDEPRYGEFGPQGASPTLTPRSLRGLAITADQYLVVGLLEPAGLLVFDLFEGGPPRQMLFPREIGFEPFDMAPRPAGGVWVLDRHNRRYWAFDSSLKVIPREQQLVVLEPEALEDFQPIGLDPVADPGAVRRRLQRSFPGGLSLDNASPLDIDDPIAIESLPDGSVLILDHDTSATSSRIYHFRFSSRLDPPLNTDVFAPYLEPDKVSSALLRGHDVAFVSAPSSPDVLGILYVASGQGTQTFAFNLHQTPDGLELEPLREYLPMRLFGGKAIVSDGGAVYYDSADRWLPLVEQYRPRYVTQGTLYTPFTPGSHVFDGSDPDCTWHRLLIDACIPHGADVRVESRAANDSNSLRDAEWQTEPRFWQRSDGMELPYVHDQGPYQTFELLFQHARGRFLQLKLTLTGNGQTTPHMRALRAYYPRFSYLTHYLPAVYSEDAISASFLDRFLANFEGILTTIEDRIAAAQTLFDPRTAPQEALDWLVSWFGVAVDPAWDNTRRRLFIRYAMLFFRQRGTLNGLYMALQIAFGDCIDQRLFTTSLAQRQSITAIRIVEQFRTRRTPGVVLGDPTDPAGLRVVAPETRWTPSETVARLQQRYTDFLATRPTTTAAVPPFDIQPPGEPAAQLAWTQFCQTVLGFVPSAAAADTPAWQAYLRRRYSTIDALNDAYRLISATRYASFEAVSLPATLPIDGPPLQDWYQFEAVVLPMRRNAHRFEVLLPMPGGGNLDDAARRDRLMLAQRVVDLEKPAHTTAVVRFYWAMFRVGEARLGMDTQLVEQSSRAPELITPFILGQGYLVESFLATADVAPICRSFVTGGQR